MFTSMIDSLIKPVNLCKAAYSYLKSTATGKAEIKGMPVSVSVELTNKCNLNCPHCASGSGLMRRERGFMDIRLFNKVMNELDPDLYNINLYFQGESMLHPLFFSFVGNCKNTFTIVSTNGHFLSEENSEKLVSSGLNKLIISLDGLDQETYSTYRLNGNINRVLDGLKNVADSKRKYNSSLKIELQFLVNRYNEDQIPKIRQLADSFHVSLRLKSMQIIHNSDIGYWLPSDRRFRRYKIKDGRYVLKNSLHNRCFRLWFNPVITWDGKVVPCCFDKDAEYVMGDLNNDSFRNIWYGPKYMDFRKRVLTDRSRIEMCRNCTSGLKGVKY